MTKKTERCPLIYFSLAALGTLLLLLAGAVNSNMHFLSAGILTIGAVALYFLIVFLTANKNFLDLFAIFSLVWLLTVGLAALRLTGYQEQWQFRTWVNLAIAYLMFSVGCRYGTFFGKTLSGKFKRAENQKFRRIRFALREERLFWICIAVTLMGVISFAINVAIRGYIPLFSQGGSAYNDFYTRFYIFTVASTMISGLCYYCIVTQKLSLTKKICLVLCIVYATFLLPIMVVSRGTFITSALSLTAAIFFLHKRRFWVLVLCVISMMLVYEVGSTTRGYSNEQLNVFFEPSQITIGGFRDPTTPSDEDVTVPQDPDEDTPVTTFTLPPKLAFLYSYLTVSHDNFNEAVQNAQDHTFGLRQLSPFNVILRIPAIETAVENAEYYQVREHLTTTNLIGAAYYDFREVGVAILVLLWAFVFGAIQGCYLEGKGVFSLLALGNTLTPVALCFFESWLSIFSHWMHWGLILVMFLCAYITFEKQKKEGK